MIENNVIEMIPEMVTIKECSTRTGVSYDWIRKLCLQDRIVYIRVGTKFLINFGRFIDYLNEGDMSGGMNDENTDQE